MSSQKRITGGSGWRRGSVFRVLHRRTLGKSQDEPKTSKIGGLPIALHRPATERMAIFKGGAGERERFMGTREQ